MSYVYQHIEMKIITSYENKIKFFIIEWVEVKSLLTRNPYNIMKQ